MPEKKKHHHEYIPIHTEGSGKVGTHEYKTKGSLSGYPISKWKKSNFKYGLHFSRHVHGIFMYPRAAIRRIIDENIVPQDLFIPLTVVIIAGLLTAIGGSMWHILLTPSVIISFFSTLKLLITIVGMPVWFIFIWLFWTGVLHVISSIASNKDIFNTQRLHKTAKVFGLVFAPAFLNILPLVSLLTGYWVWILSAWAIEINYGLNRKRAFLVTIPLLFATILGTFIRLSVL
jgi:hypothetical protein